MPSRRISTIVGIMCYLIRKMFCRLNGLDIIAVDDWKHWPLMTTYFTSLRSVRGLVLTNWSAKINRRWFRCGTKHYYLFRVLKPNPISTKSKTIFTQHVIFSIFWIDFLSLAVTFVLFIPKVASADQVKSLKIFWCSRDRLSILTKV